MDVHAEVFVHRILDLVDEIVLQSPARTDDLVSDSVRTRLGRLMVSVHELGGPQLAHVCIKELAQYIALYRQLYAWRREYRVMLALYGILYASA